MTDENRTTQSGTPVLSLAVVLLVAAGIIAGGVAVTAALSGGSDSNSQASPASPPPGHLATTADGIVLPEYVLAAWPEAQTAYRFAAERPDVLAWIPCYCGCRGHSGHRSVLECFIKRDGTPSNVEFDQHASECVICVDIALDTKAMLERGESLPDIRDYIDTEYGDVGPGTDTPLPPA